MEMDGELKKYLEGLRNVDLSSKTSGILSALDNVSSSLSSLESSISSSMWSELGKVELTSNTLPYLASSTANVKSSVQILDTICKECEALRSELIELESLIKKYNGLKAKYTNSDGTLNEAAYNAAKSELKAKIDAKTSSCKAKVSAIKGMTIPSFDISFTSSALTGGSTRTLSGNFSNYLFVGDSRVVGMASCNAGSNCTFYGEVGQGLSWLKNNQSEIESQIQSVSKNATGDTAVVFWMGVNDCSYVNGESYASYFNDLQKKYPDVQICVASVGAVDDNLSSNVKNSDIQRFNSELEENLVQTVKWVDVYDYTVSHNCANSGDPYGVHYTYTSYEQIIQLMKERLSA